MWAEDANRQLYARQSYVKGMVRVRTIVRIGKGRALSSSQSNKDILGALVLLLGPRPGQHFPRLLWRPNLTHKADGVESEP
mmetsp:Transcript_16849/g.50991  ORF Transcript_16849/g.50991 Transcript_16849/m.50991 type:complete len:81 (-) Transcript_16849:773-1015(-)